jgi:hypothetical protein
VKTRLLFVPEKLTAKWDQKYPPAAKPWKNNQAYRQGANSFSIEPYYWFKGSYYDGPSWLISAAKCLPWMDKKPDRCAGKND